MRCIHGAFVEYIHFIIVFVSPVRWPKRRHNRIDWTLMVFLCFDIYLYTLFCMWCACKSSTSHINQNRAPATWIYVDRSAGRSVSPLRVLGMANQSNAIARFDLYTFSCKYWFCPYFLFSHFAHFSFLSLCHQFQGNETSLPMEMCSNCK